MKVPKMILLVLFLALCTIILLIMLQPEYFYGIEYDVRVINGFTNNSSLPLVIWCVSDYGDLGGRALQEGDDFSWRLKTNLWGTTRYMCTMKWDEKRKKFDAFMVPRDTHRCSPLRMCSWLVREDGFYFSNDGINWKKDFSWS
ncbi:Self-incomp_S1 domain-containing protein [Cephalotus follicularis]|uniref:S-protein homolog n=1 Tax=Cephalotus follicularis TaxID=3775 RepID=A0A1Q3B6J5_CEPFO|nr:Self-incomp_S1 domain-containing protein [Cephalotus follicularis]